MARRVVSRMLERAEGERGPHLEEILYETLYAEQRRLAREEPDPRTEADQSFVGLLKHELVHGAESGRPELLHSVVKRYVDEISGHFDPRVYKVATRVLPGVLGSFLHKPRLGEPRMFDLEERVLVQGEVERLRLACRLGTVILAPTHVSNLDALALGVMLYRLGLPPFAYGAGLNLFSNGPAAFFMRNLGAYTVDRKKTDPLYRETVKEYVTVLLERGQHNLFFPGGTRSRSGAIETRLKKGLLGTAPRAFRHALAARAPRPHIFVVPCTLTYPLVLEAETLARDYLRAEGGAHFVDMRDEFERPRRWLEFLRGLLELDERVQVRIARPLDIVGNEVDLDGCSLDPHGRRVDASRYLVAGDRLTADRDRDAAYTGLLEARLVDVYHRDNVAVPTSAVAFVVMELLRRKRAQPDLFRFLRSLGSEGYVAEDPVHAELQRLQGELAALEASSRIRLSDDLRGATTENVLSLALETFRTYHRAPVLERRGPLLHVNDANLLFYYRNRLSGYGLLGAPELLPKSTTHRAGRES